MVLNIEKTLHCRCSFELRPRTGAGADWPDIIKTIRKLVSSHYESQELGRRWFFAGRESRTNLGIRHVSVQTARCIADGTENDPRHWAIRFEHPCKKEHHRQWRTDIGVSKIGHDRYRFTLSTAHWMRVQMREEPYSPHASVPRIVTDLISSSKWQSYSGADLITVQPIPLVQGQGNAFLNRRRRKIAICLLS